MASRDQVRALMIQASRPSRCAGRIGKRPPRYQGESDQNPGGPSWSAFFWEVRDHVKTKSKRGAPDFGNSQSGIRAQKTDVHRYGMVIGPSNSIMLLHILTLWERFSLVTQLSPSILLVGLCPASVWGSGFETQHHGTCRMSYGACLPNISRIGADKEAHSIPERSLEKSPEISAERPPQPRLRRLPESADAGLAAKALKSS